MTGKDKKTKGMTLIELMIVVVIIGILATMAMPRFMRIAAKAKQSEAKQLLKQIYTMQEAYFGMHEHYCLDGIVAASATPFAFAQIHVDVMLPARYSYTMAATQSTFTCTATGNIDTDGTIDTWTIDDQGNLINTIDDTAD
jgi:prepilin-type N-terminal cleavage/methylation domain-containing protein